MNLHLLTNRKPRRRAALAALGCLLLGPQPLSAQSFTYTNGDLVAAFRLAGGASDLVANLGPVSVYESLPPRSVLSVTNLAPSQLASALPTLDGVSWCVAAALRGNPAYAQYSLQTIWLTSPCPDSRTLGPAWPRASIWTLGGAASQIDAIGANAATYGNALPAGDANTATGIIIPTSSYYAYTTQVGAYGKLGGTFAGEPENTTPADFEAGGQPSRSVLYRLEPAAYPYGPGALLGFFDFYPDGTLTFTAGPPPQPATLTQITRTGDLVAITFPTVSQVGYRLRYTDSEGLAAAPATWSVGASLIGDGTPLTLQDTNASPARFYTVEAF